VDPNTGAWVSVSTTTGRPAAPFARVNLEVRAAAPDGSGEWYIGGDFTLVQGIERNRIAHILSDGTLDPSWNPNANGGVRALAVSGGVV
jgi:hypothetical protein